MKTQKEPIPEQLKETSLNPVWETFPTWFFSTLNTGSFPDKTAFVYLIGAAFLEGGSFVLHQYLAEDLSAEEAILKAFSECTKGKKKLIHFNGSTFDLPFLQARYKKVRSGLLRILHGADRSVPQNQPVKKCA